MRSRDRAAITLTGMMITGTGAEAVILDKPILLLTWVPLGVLLVFVIATRP